MQYAIVIISQCLVDITIVWVGMNGDNYTLHQFVLGTMCLTLVRGLAWVMTSTVHNVSLEMPSAFDN